MSQSTHRLSRRNFLLSSSAAVAGSIIACAVNPVTGKRQFMLLSQEDEIGIDRINSPHQFSNDFGVSQDGELNAYLTQVGKAMAPLTHRPDMPYSFQVVNATYVNAYAFPGGTIAATRGIMLELDNEAELAALLGHELGHVNARHTADRMSKQMLLGAAVLIGGAVVSEKNETAGLIVQGVGMLGQTMLLAHYSREDEHQADKLGMTYMVQAGYDPDGMVGLMDMLKSLSDHKPSAIEQMFASHPMSDERYAKAVKRASTKYPDQSGLKILKERYMDNTAALRRQKDVIQGLQDAQRAMAGEKWTEANSLFSKALKKAPRDYAGLMMMAQCQFMQEKYQDALRYAQRGQKAYPGEGQAHMLEGLAELSLKRWEPAYTAFQKYDELLPGNPGATFYQGFSQENMQHQNQAAVFYQKFLNAVSDGEQADHARNRLIQWGYIQPAVEQP